MHLKVCRKRPCHSLYLPHKHRDLNRGPFAPESKTVTTVPRSVLFSYNHCWFFFLPCVCVAYSMTSSSYQSNNFLNQSVTSDMCFTCGHPVAFPGFLELYNVKLQPFAENTHGDFGQGRFKGLFQTSCVYYRICIIRGVEEETGWIGSSGSVVIQLLEGSNTDQKIVTYCGRFDGVYQSLHRNVHRGSDNFWISIRTFLQQRRKLLLYYTWYMLLVETQFPVLMNFDSSWWYFIIKLAVDNSTGTKLNLCFCVFWVTLQILSKEC